MAAYHKVEVSLNTNAVEVGVPSPQTVNVVVPTIGPAGPVGSVGPVGPQGPQGVPGTGLEVLTTQGDLLYQGASTGQRLGIGTSGQILRVANGIPSWGNESGAVTSVNGETGTVILDGSEIDSSANDVRAAFTAGAFGDGNGIYYPLPDTTLNSKRVYRNTTGHHVFFQSLRWHITDGSPITANIIESSDDDNAAWPWLSAWSGDVDKARIADVIGRARSTFLFVGDSVPSTSVSGLGTAATSDSTAFASASHTHGNLTNAGAIGTTANLPLKTGTNGVIEAGSFSNAAGTFCEGNDARLSDDRDPNLHAASHLPDGADEIFDQSLNTDDSVTFANVSTDVVTCTFFSDADEFTQIQFDGGVHRLINNSTETVTVSDSDASFAVPIAFGGEDAATNAATTRDNLSAAASGSITTSGLTQATARILGRTTASTGAVEEIQIGAGLSLSAGELSSTVSAGIPATIVDAKGDLIVASAADTVARLPVGGTNGHVLTVDSAETLGVKWAAASGGGISSVGPTADDVFSVSGSNLVADDGGLINSANPAVVWDDVAGKLVYANPLARPSGAGSMFIGLAPSTTALGTNAICIQTSRSNANQVAEDTDSIVIGTNARAHNNNATGSQVVIGPNARAQFRSGVAIGSSSFAQEEATAVGLQASASQSASVAIGLIASASAPQGVAVGRTSTASADLATAVGPSVTANLRSQFITRTFGTIYWGGQTTNATATILNLDAQATSRFTIAASTALAVDILLVARRSDTQDKWLIARRFLGIRRDGSNNTSLIGSVQTLGVDQSEGSPSWTFALTADDTNEALQLEVTGAASETIQWRATAFYRVA